MGMVGGAGVEREEAHFVIQYVDINCMSLMLCLQTM